MQQDNDSDKIAEGADSGPIRSWLSRHAGSLALLGVLTAVWIVDRSYYNSRIAVWFWGCWTQFGTWAAANWSRTEVVVGLPLLTLFLGFANLYLKISVRAESIQRQLRPRVFLSIPFAVYFGAYLLLTILAYLALKNTIQSTFVAIIASALIGIGAANADVKFGGFSVQPLAEFLRGLEAVVESGISGRIGELDIASRAELRDELAKRIDIEVLERECILLGMTAEEIAALKQKANNNANTLRGLMAVEIVKKSEPNAKRLVAEALPERLRWRFRWWQ
jgi:hypothetical protein